MHNVESITGIALTMDKVLNEIEALSIFTRYDLRIHSSDEIRGYASASAACPPFPFSTSFPSALHIRE
jgi:hypothetical protein